MSTIKHQRNEDEKLALQPTIEFGYPVINLMKE